MYANTHTHTQNMLRRRRKKLHVLAAVSSKNICNVNYKLAVELQSTY